MRFTMMLPTTTRVTLVVVWAAAIVGGLPMPGPPDARQRSEPFDSAPLSSTRHHHNALPFDVSNGDKAHKTTETTVPITELTADEYYLQLVNADVVDQASNNLPADTEQSLQEAQKDGLLVLVPTVSLDKKDSTDPQDIEYELIAIPGDVLTREIRQIYGVPESSGYLPPKTEASSLAGNANSFTGNLDFTPQTKPIPSFDSSTSSFSSSSSSFNSPSLGSSSLGGSTFTLQGTPAHVGGVALPTLPGKPNVGQLLQGVGTIAGQAANVGGQVLQGVGNLAGKAAIQGAAVSQVLTDVGSAAAVGSSNAIRWLIDTKAKGLRTAAQLAGGGLQYASQLSGSVLRALLQIPAIKARVLGEIVRASTPLVTAISDVVAESSDDLGAIIEAKTTILAEALNIIIRLVQDTLALNGRIIAKLGASGLDTGATLFNAGVRIGSAFVESAGGIASAVGSGVEDVVRVASQVNLPPPPALPKLEFPNLSALLSPSAGATVKPVVLPPVFSTPFTTPTVIHHSVKDVPSTAPHGSNYDSSSAHY